MSDGPAIAFVGTIARRDGTRRRAYVVAHLEDRRGESHVPIGHAVRCTGCGRVQGAGTLLTGSAAGTREPNGPAMYCWACRPFGIPWRAEVLAQTRLAPPVRRDHAGIFDRAGDDATLAYARSDAFRRPIVAARPAMPEGRPMAAPA